MLQISQELVNVCDVIGKRSHQARFFCVQSLEFLRPIYGGSNRHICGKSNSDIKRKTRIEIVSDFEDI